mgnify:CR=1 FL=1
MSILEVKNISLHLNEQTILRDLNFSLDDGGIYAVIGPNGAGKSTLASTVMGLSGYREHSGDILFKGQSIKDLSIDQRARLGITLAWQEPARYEGLTVEAFIKAGAAENNDHCIEKTLDAVGLEPDRYRGRAMDKTLSGGERKRIELASILAARPELVIMDEPDSGIDVEALNKIFDAIQQFKEMNTTVLLITHSLTVLEKAEYAFLICCGHVIDQGGVDKIAGYFRNKCVPCDHTNFPSASSPTGE